MSDYGFVPCSGIAPENLPVFKMSRDMRKPDFAYVKTKTQISCTVAVQLISAFVFAT